MPVPKSSGSISSTLAPFVTSLWASVTNVASLPCAFWTMMSEAGRPAAAAAFFRYGASNSTYRVELVVSGRIAAILPFPADASDLSAAIAEKLVLNDVAETDGVELDELVELVELVVELDEFELPHAANASPAAAATTGMAALFPIKCMWIYSS